MLKTNIKTDDNEDESKVCCPQCTVPITGNLVGTLGVTLSTSHWPPFIKPDLTRGSIANHIPNPSLKTMVFAIEWLKVAVFRWNVLDFIVCTCDQPEADHLCWRTDYFRIQKDNSAVEARDDALHCNERSVKTCFNHVVDHVNHLNHVVDTCAGTSGGWRTRSGNGFFCTNIVQLLLKTHHSFLVFYANIFNFLTLV